MAEFIKPTQQEIIAALDKVRTFARFVLQDMCENAGGDAYEYVGSMDQVEALREAIDDAEGLHYRVKP